MNKLELILRIHVTQSKLEELYEYYKFNPNDIRLRITLRSLYNNLRRDKKRLRRLKRGRYSNNERKRQSI